MTLLGRPEKSEDIAAIRRVHESAFPTPAEARLVERLRETGAAVVSLVAESEGRVVGHILFSPVTVGEEGGPPRGLGLAPVAVLPPHQGVGVGSLLIREGLAACGAAGYSFAVVLGEPEYYRRFGFRKASLHGLGNEYGADDAFMVIELQPGGLPAGGGLVKYAPAFAELTE